MNSKQFEYQNRDIPFLKKDVIYRLSFLGLFFAIFIWQFVSLIIKLASKEDVNIVMIVASTFVLLFSLLFCAVSVMYAIKSLKIIGVVRKTGRCVSSVNFVFDTKKTSFVKLYSIINQILSVVTALIFISSLTFTILKAAYTDSISFYMPCLAAICLCGLNSIYHLNSEAKIMDTVQQYNNLY